MKIDYGDHTIFVKQNLREFLPLFKQEAEQLEMLAKSKTITVPKVYGVGSNKHHSFLLLEYFPLKSFDATNAWRFGQQLAHLHQWEEQPSYGFDFDTMLGTITQPNGWEKRWNSFFAEKRIGLQLQIAAEKGMVFGDIQQIVDIVKERLTGHQPQPSLLHGDLWPANCAMTQEQNGILYDPACYWGIENVIWQCCLYTQSYPSKLLTDTKVCGLYLRASSKGNLFINFIIYFANPIFLALKKLFARTYHYR